MRPAQVLRGLFWLVVAAAHGRWRRSWGASASPALAMPFSSPRLATSSPLVSASWAVVAPMLTTRALHTTTLLPNGKMLAAGGFSNRTTGQALSTAELYDPASGLWSTTGNLTIH